MLPPRVVQSGGKANSNCDAAACGAAAVADGRRVCQGGGSGEDDHAWNAQYCMPAGRPCRGWPVRSASRPPPDRRRNPGSIPPCSPPPRRKAMLVVYSSTNEREGLAIFKLFDGGDRHQGPVRARRRQRADLAHDDRVQGRPEFLRHCAHDRDQPVAAADAGAIRAARGQAHFRQRARSRSAAGTASTPSTTRRPTIPSW